MPAKGGAFFGFAIVVAAALITWGIIALVDVANDDSSSDDGASTRGTGSSELQDMLNGASPGDVFYIPEGTNEFSLTTAVDGTEENPITITCAGDSRGDCVLKGDEDRTRVLEVLHSWYIIEGFTIDGEWDDDDYKEQLIFVQGIESPTAVSGVETSVTGVTIKDMVLRNAGKECVRIRYFVTNSVVQDSDIGPCGVYDFQVDSNDDNNGEGVYIGTALDQIDDKGDVDERVDECSGIVVMNNNIDTQGSEGVDIKEGSFGNLVYDNYITGQMDVNVGGVSLRGTGNFVTENTIEDGQGACVRIGGDSSDGIDYGRNNEVYDNDFNGCLYSSVKVNEAPQVICGNDVTRPDELDDDEVYLHVTGDAADEFPSITDTCDSSDITDISALLGFGSRDFVADDSDSDSVDDDDDDDENDDGAVAAQDSTGSYEYLNCLQNRAAFPLEMFDYAAASSDPSLSVEKCISMCVSDGPEAPYEFAGIQNGQSCWCGDGGTQRSEEHFDEYGNGVDGCTTPCSGSGEANCGGVGSFSLYQIFGDGGVDNQGDDDGGMSSDGDVPPTSSNHDDSDDLTTSETGSVVVVDDDEETFQEPEDDASGNDDTETPVTGGTYEGCFTDNDVDPILVFAYEGDGTMTPDNCIAECSSKNEALAGLQDGDECWCGTVPENGDVGYSRYGAGLCNMPCEGDSTKTCGGDGSVDVYIVNST